MAEDTKATQEFVPVQEVRDGIVVLKDGSLRAVLMASSLNFALKSEDEQTAIIIQFQSFLHSLEFSTQLFIQSRKLDIRPYIALLEKQYTEQLDDLMKIQVREYIEFIKNFTESVNIMSKSFFVVVPYSPAVLETKKGANVVSELLKRRKEQYSIRQKSEVFEEHRTQLDQRIAVIQQGLIRSGVRVLKLGTEEVIELLYKIFNPGELEKPIQLEDL